MTSKFRRMKPYHPRKRKTKKEMNKQRLHDLTHKISSTVGALLVLMKEGKSELVQETHQRAKNDFMKLAPEVQHIAQTLGNHCAQVVAKYLESVDRLIHSNPMCLDAGSSL